MVPFDPIIQIARAPMLDSGHHDAERWWIALGLIRGHPFWCDASFLDCALKKASAGLALRRSEK
jgi:hypothetical protein